MTHEELCDRLNQANVYRDTIDRYNRDPEFKAVVHFLYDAALRFGYTPGELRQAAFMAALECEEYGSRTVRDRMRTRDEMSSGPKSRFDESYLDGLVQKVKEKP